MLLGKKKVFLVVAPTHVTRRASLGPEKPDNELQVLLMITSYRRARHFRK